jgi:hypothetical protein
MSNPKLEGQPDTYGGNKLKVINVAPNTAMIIVEFIPIVVY